MKILTVITDNYDSETIVGESPADLTFEEKMQLDKDMWGNDLDELVHQWLEAESNVGVYTKHTFAEYLKERIGQ